MPSSTAAAAFLLLVVVIVADVSTAATSKMVLAKAVVRRNVIDEEKSSPSSRSGRGAFYSRVENYPSPTSVRLRPVSESKHFHGPDKHDPDTRPLAFRPDTFNGRSPFLTFNGRDSSDFLGPGSLGQALPADARRHFVPPSADFLRRPASADSRRLVVGSSSSSAVDHNLLSADPSAPAASAASARSPRGRSARRIDVGGPRGATSRIPRTLFFGDLDHGSIVLRYQDELLRQGRPPLKLGSVRPGFAFFRHNY